MVHFSATHGHKRFTFIVAPAHVYSYNSVSAPLSQHQLFYEKAPFAFLTQGLSSLYQHIFTLPLVAGIIHSQYTPKIHSYITFW